MVLQGVRLAWARGFRRVMLEVDSKLVVGWLLAHKEPRLSLVNLTQACKKELEKNWEIHIVHAYRECNRAAHLLASATLHHDR